MKGNNNQSLVVPIPKRYYIAKGFTMRLGSYVDHKFMLQINSSRTYYLHDTFEQFWGPLEKVCCYGIHFEINGHIILYVQTQH